MHLAEIHATTRLAAPYPARLRAPDVGRPVRTTEPAQPNPAPPGSVPEQSPLAIAAAAPSIDWLRNQYAESRLRRAVEDYSNQPDSQVQHAGNANDLGTIAGLALLQPYRVAMANPQVQELQAAAVKLASAGTPKIANIGPTENVTDNARYRPGSAP